MSEPEVFVEPLSETAVRLSCFIRTTSERAYDAWTLPEELAKWFVPESDIVCTPHEFDVRVGGRFRFSLDSPAMSCMAAGEYMVLDRPRRMMFTWRWEDRGPDAWVSLVTLDFIPHEDGTRFVMTHERNADIEGRDNHARGWSGCLVSYSEYLNRFGSQ